MKKQMRRVFHCHPTRELGLKGNAMLFEPGHYVFSLFRSEDANKNMRALQIGVDLNVIDGDKRAVETDFARYDSTQLPFYDFVDPQHAMFHKALSFPSKFLRHGFELIALDHVANVVFIEVPELDTTFQTRPDFFHIVLKTAERGKSAVINRLTLSDHPGAAVASNSPVCDQTAGDDSSAEFENLFHFGMAQDGFAEFRIEQSGHRVFHLVDQLVNDAVKV